MVLDNYLPSNIQTGRKLSVPVVSSAPSKTDFRQNSRSQSRQVRLVASVAMAYRLSPTAVNSLNKGDDQTSVTSHNS